MEKRAADLLPVPYYHVVFTMPAEIARIAFQNKAAVYDLLFRASAETLMTIATDPKHLGARIGMTSVLHTWGSALTHHPHVHIVVPGGGLSEDSERWTPCRDGFFLPVRVLSRLFRRLFLEGLAALHTKGKLRFFGELEPVREADAFARYLAPFRKSEWVVYAKAPFGGPEAVLAYLSRYTHRVAISNGRLLTANADTVTFRYKDYRRKGANRQQTMRLATSEFIRRFLIHVLPRGFHRIRHYGLFANASRARNIACIRDLLGAEAPLAQPEPNNAADAPSGQRILSQPCPDCGGPMIVIESFDPSQIPRSRAPPYRGAA